MTGPRPTSTPSRLNVGGYQVTGREEMFKSALPFPPYRRRAGTVAPDGSLSLEPEAWQVRHYRRAVMRGAGVYQADLWAFLGGYGAALWGNDCYTLKRIQQAGIDRAQALAATWLNETPDDQPYKYNPARFRRAGRRGSAPPRGAAYGLQTQVYTPIRILSHAFRALDRLFSSPFGRTWVSAVAQHGYYLAALSAKGHPVQNIVRRANLSCAYQCVLASIIKRGDAYRAHLARRIKPQRTPRRLSRPLYSRAIPPAAPLAPPALA